MLDEHLKLELCDDNFTKSGGRALATLIVKYNINKNFNYDSYTHSFKTCIFPVMLYGSEACGYYKFKKCGNIQYQAKRFFLEVHTFTPNIGLQGDMGWVYLSVDRHVSMVRFWNRLMSMNSERLLKRIFLWDNQLNNN